MTPRRIARYDREKAIVLEYWIPCNSENHTSEYGQEYREAIDTAKVLVQWTEEHP